MIRSMTGFGAATRERDGVTIRVEVRSVNHRHFQAKLRVPSEFLYLESELDALVRKRLSRGSVSVNVSLTRDESQSVAALNTDAAKRYHTALVKLAKELGVAPEVDLAHILNMPGVLGAKASGLPNERDGKLILRTTSEAVTELLSMRESEGKSLGVELERAATAIEKAVARIEKRMPKVVREHHQNLRKRASELIGAEKPVAETDLARELALLADRLDVTEETSRLRSHLSQLRGLLSKGGAVGRQLDFLAQEFFREANTTGAKCNDAQVAHVVVDMKTHIERMREQIQNVE